MNKTSAVLEVDALGGCLYPCSDSTIIAQKYLGTTLKVTQENQIHFPVVTLNFFLTQNPSPNLISTLFTNLGSELSVSPN